MHPMTTSRTREGERAEAERKMANKGQWQRESIARKRALGQKPLQLWIYPETEERLRKYAERLQARAERERAPKG